MIRIMKFTSHEQYCIHTNRDECHKTDRIESDVLHGASNALKQRQLRDSIGLLIKKIRCTKRQLLKFNWCLIASQPTPRYALQ